MIAVINLSFILYRFYFCSFALLFFFALFFFYVYRKLSKTMPKVRMKAVDGKIKDKEKDCLYEMIESASVMRKGYNMMTRCDIRDYAWDPGGGRRV